MVKLSNLSHSSLVQVLFFLKLVAIFAPTGYPLINPIIKAKAPSPRILKSGFIYLFKIFPSCVIILVCIKSSVATKKGKREGITEFDHRAKPDFTAGKLLFENNNKLKVKIRKIKGRKFLFSFIKLIK